MNLKFVSDETANQLLIEGASSHSRSGLMMYTMHSSPSTPLTMIYRFENATIVFTQDNQLSARKEEVTTLETKLHNAEEKLKELQTELEARSRCAISISVPISC